MIALSGFTKLQKILKNFRFKNIYIYNFSSLIISKLIKNLNLITIQILDTNFFSIFSRVYIVHFLWYPNSRYQIFFPSFHVYI